MAGQAVEVLRKKRSELETFVDSLNALTRSLTAIGFHPPTLNPGECALRVAIPAEYIRNNSEGLADQLEKIDKMLKLFSTVFEGSRIDFEILQISSSNPRINLKIAWKTALACSLQ